MRGRTHVLLGVAASAPLAVSMENPLPVLAGAALGSLLPDLDHPESTLGHWLHVPLRHRGPLHSLLAALFFASLSLAVLSVVAWFASDAPWYAAGVGIGYVVHLLADIPSGRVPLLWPFRLRRI